MYLVTYRRWGEFHNPMGIGKQLVEADSVVDAIYQAQRKFSTLDFNDTVYSATGFEAVKL